MPILKEPTTFKKLFIETYGCQMNVRDAEEVTGLLLEKGYALTESGKEADVILFNTCSVREHAEDKVWSSLGTLKDLKRERPELIIGVMGCMAKAQRGKIFRRAPYVDFISGPSQLYEVPELIDAIYEERRPMMAIQEKVRKEFQTISYHSGKVTALVTIMEGCNKVCSYCIIPYTRGPEVSRPPEEIIEEVKRLVGQGYREVMLLGQNVNSYGKMRASTGSARTEEATFAGLLAKVNAIPGIERIRFITSHPWDAVEELFAAMRDLPHVCEHLHLPVQSGSDTILEKMRRGYTGQEYLQKLELLRTMVPEVAVTTDIIVGFPGETEEDFEATHRLMEQARFDSAFIFTYSPRPFAAASRWADDVLKEVKDRRLQTLLALQEKISTSEAEKGLGSTVEVLVEEPGMGRTRRNRKAYFSADAASAGKLIEMQVKSIRGQSFMGTVAAWLLAMTCVVLTAFAAEDLTATQSAFLKGEYATVLAQTRERLSSPPVSSEDELLYLQGVAALKLQELDLAKESLDRLLDQFPQSSREVEAKIALAQVLVVSGDRTGALQILERLLQEEKAAPLEPQIREVLAHTQEFYYSVQVGAFRTQDNAMRLKKELDRRGYDAWVNKAESGGDVFHRIRVGRFQEKQDAQAQAKKIRSEGFPAHVVP